jgi:hypothetical protein
MKSNLPLGVLMLLVAACSNAPRGEEVGTVARAISSPSPLFTVKGDDQFGDNQCNCIPPDTNGAVSSSFIVTTVNAHLNVKDRAGTLLLSQDQNQFWAPVDPTANSFDSRARFDPLAQRFIITAADHLSISNPETCRLLVAVSKTADPTGDWNKYAFAGDQVCLDFPVVGYNKKWIVVTGTLTNMAGNAFIGQWAFDKAALYAGAVSPPFTFFNHGYIFSAVTQPILPAETYDAASEDEFYVRAIGNGNTELFRLSGPVGSETFSSVAVIPSPWPIGATAAGLPQAGGTPTNLSVSENSLGTFLTELVDRSMQDCVFRNGSIWATGTTVPSDGGQSRVSVKWLQIAPNGTLQDFGRVDDPTGQSHFIMPSIAVNRFNDVLLGFSRFSQDTFPSAAYSLRSAGVLGDPVIYRAGVGPYFEDRWGDYSHTQVDPINDRDFWTVQETTSASDTWLTWWAEMAPRLPVQAAEELIDPMNAAVSPSGARIGFDPVGSGVVEASLLSSSQGIAVMSRNLSASTLSQHPSWTSHRDNVVGIDAVLLLEQFGAGCINDPESSQHWMRLILGGVDGSGSHDACSHQARVDAIAALASCMGTDQIKHVYRPDDNSGTSDFLRSTLGITDFCNDDAGQGQSHGPANVNDADKDPIRTQCVSMPGFAATPCQQDGTLGFVVALSDIDSGTSNVQISIAKRVAADISKTTIGLASREAKYGPSVLGVRVIKVDTRNPTPTNVRTGFYPWSHLLFVHSADLTDPAITNADPTGEQQKFLAWATGVGADPVKNPGCFDNGNPICGRANLDPLMAQAGYVTCGDDPFTIPSNSLCFPTTPPPFSPPTSGPSCGATGTSCSTGSGCCSGTCNGSVCSAARQAGFACAQNSDCVSGSCDHDFSPFLSGICD